MTLSSASCFAEKTPTLPQSARPWQRGGKHGNNQALPVRFLGLADPTHE